MLEAIGFDFDDTIIRTEQLVGEVVAKTIMEIFGKRIVENSQKVRPKLKEKELEKEIARHLFSGLSLPTLLNVFGITYTREEIQEAYSQIDSRRNRLYDFVSEATLFKGVRKFLEHLEKIKRARRAQRLKFVLFIASHADMEWVAINLENLGLIRYFDEFCTVFPKQKGIKKILEKHKIKPENCLFIGDRIEDLNAAQELGLRFLGMRKSTEQMESELYLETREQKPRIINDYTNILDKLGPLDKEMSQQIKKRIQNLRKIRKQTRKRKPV